MFNIFKKKEKNSRDHFDFVIFDSDMKIIAGANNIELAKDICNMVAQDSKDRFYISSDTYTRIYCLEDEQNTEYYEELQRAEDFARSAPFIPFDHN